MEPATVIAFGLSFVAGPLLCAALLRLPPRPVLLGALALCVAITVILAFVYGAHVPAGGAQAMVFLWLAWVLAIAMLTLALRKRAQTSATRRWLTVGAILATTLPWFGLATARLVG